MDTQISNIGIPYQQIQSFCERNHIRKLALFGSVLRSDFRTDSDVDMLVEYEPETHVGLFGMAGHEIQLSQMLRRKVDLRTPQDLSRFFRQQVADHAVTIYERG